MSTGRLFTSESVTEGHPDKLADVISDSVLDALMAQDPRSRVAVDTLVTTGQVHVVGEVTTTAIEAFADIPKTVRGRILDIGYDASEKGFDGGSCGVNIGIDRWAPDIAMGVDTGIDGRFNALQDQRNFLGAADQGVMFGYAIEDTPELMPLPIAIAHRLARRLTEVRKSGVLDYLRPDGKVQVTVQYDGSTPVRLDTVVLSTQHAEAIDLEGTLGPDIREKVVNTVLADLAHDTMDTTDYRLLVNPTGKFVLGGPMGDAGLTGRKIFDDTYGGWARHGGGAFSGKDPSNVDRSAAYAMRWVAKNVVAAGLAERVEVQVAYAVGKVAPVGLFVETFGSETVDPALIEKAITEVFDLRPGAIMHDLDLLRPIYAPIAAYGHFGRSDVDLPWERTDRVDELKEMAFSGSVRRRITRPPSETGLAGRLRLNFDTGDGKPRGIDWTAERVGEDTEVTRQSGSFTGGADQLISTPERHLATGEDRAGNRSGRGSDVPPELGTRRDVDQGSHLPASRFLQARMPERAETTRPLSLRVAIVLTPGEAGAASALKPFDVPDEGTDVTVIVFSPGLIPKGEMQQVIRVPPADDSEPHLFSFIAGPVGLHAVTVEVYRGGTFLGAVRLQVSVERNVVPGHEAPLRAVPLGAFSSEAGEMTLQVSRDGPPGRGGRQEYRFQLLGSDALYPIITEAMMGSAETAISQLVEELNVMAANQSPYGTSDLIRERLRNLGIELWTSAIPKTVQEQFWEQAGRIKMFTVASEDDAIPWELLFPANGSNENGFLAEQFPVVRRVHSRERVTSIPVASAAYVVPPNSPSNAADEIAAIRALLGTEIGDRGVLSDLANLSEMIMSPDPPGILHFACHNSFSEQSGSSIALAGGPWRPSDLASAVARTSLASTHPLVFMNACRSAGQIPAFFQQSGWAQKFISAGAGAFIGSLWAVRSSSARAFAEVFYKQFVDEGQPLGESTLAARKAVSEEGGDPTWLAYSVYGNPAALALR